MNFSIVISAHPDSYTAKAALNFCKAVITTGSNIYRVFFLGPGTLNGNSKHPLNHQWQVFIKTHAIDATCCVASSQEHGLANDTGKPTSLLSEEFAIAGLGQLIEAQKHSDRVVTFGERSHAGEKA